jgi:hypothetical protein
LGDIDGPGSPRNGMDTSVRQGDANLTHREVFRLSRSRG